VCWALIVAAAAPALAQTKGRIGVGLGLSVASPRDGTQTVVSVTPLTRVPPRNGWRSTIGLNWMTTEVEVQDVEIYQLRFRPLMGGISYTHVSGRSAVIGSLVAGPSFNRIRLHEEQWPAGTTADIDNSFAARVGSAYNYSVTDRVGVQVFGAYLVNRPEMEIRTPGGGSGGVPTRRFKADTPIFSVSAVYSLF
jgi:hypothetical protein